MKLSLLDRLRRALRRSPRSINENQSEFERSERSSGPDLRLWPQGRMLRFTLEALQAEAHHLARSPELTFPLLYNELYHKHSNLPEVRAWCELSAARFSRTWFRRTAPDRTRSPNLRATFVGHEDVVSECRFSLDSRYVASVCLGGSLRIWDVASGRELACLIGDSQSLRDCCWSPDGRRIAVVGDTQLLRIWDWQNGRVAKEFDITDRNSEPNPRSLMFSCCDWSPDGKGVLCGFGTWTYQAVLWDANTGAQLWGIPRTGHLEACAFSPDGLLVGLMVDSAVYVYAIPTRKREKPALLFERRVRSGGNACCFSSDGRAFAYVGGEEFRSVDTRDWSETRIGRDPGLDCALSPDGQNLLVVGGLRMLGGAGLSWTGLYDARSAEEVGKLTGHQDMVLACDWSSDGQLLATGSRDGTVKLWEACFSQMKSEERVHTFGVSGLAWRPDGERVLSAGRDGRAHIWDSQTASWLDTLSTRDTPTSTPLSDCDSAPDGSAFVLGDEKGVLDVIDATALTVRWSVQSDEQATLSCAWASLGDRIASCGTEGVKAWNAQTGELLAHIEDTANATKVRFSPDGRLLAVQSPSSLKLIEIATMRQTGVAHVVFDSGHEMAWSPDGLALLVGDYDQTVVVLDPVTQVPLRRLAGHRGVELASSAYSGRYGARSEVLCQFIDGNRLAVTAYVDGILKVWDIQSGKMLTHFPTDVAFRCMATSRRRMCLGDDQGHLHWFSLENIEESLSAVSPSDWLPQELCGRCRSDFLEKIKIEDGRELLKCPHCGWWQEIGA